jgi:hypothetical protein
MTAAVLSRSDGEAAIYGGYHLTSVCCVYCTLQHHMRRAVRGAAALAGVALAVTSRIRDMRAKHPSVSMLCMCHVQRRTTRIAFAYMRCYGARVWRGPGVRGIPALHQAPHVGWQRTQPLCQRRVRAVVARTAFLVSQCYPPVLFTPVCVLDPGPCLRFGHCISVAADAPRRLCCARPL